MDLLPVGPVRNFFGLLLAYASRMNVCGHVPHVNLG